MKPIHVLLVGVCVVGAGCRTPQQTSQSTTQQQTDPMVQQLQTTTARFAPVELSADISALAPNERQALTKLVEAAKAFDALYLRQVWEGNEPMLTALAADETPPGRARLHYFLINKGPWSRLDGNEPFVPGVGAKPEEGNFYPAGATKAEVEAWIKGLPESAASDA
jgi:hypothetical protein